MLSLILSALLSFSLTILISFPFISLLYKFNVRRLAKVDLEKALPGRSVKLGTPIMGGTVIILVTLLLSYFLIGEWEYFSMIAVVLIVGSIFGGVDEYINTLGRTIKAIRISRRNGESKSLIPTKGVFTPIKKMLLVPWKMFEEILRVTGSQQRGLKSHYKFLLQIIIAVISIAFFLDKQHSAAIHIPFMGTYFLGYFYYATLAFMLLFFANAFGITDGMDGLSAGSHSIVFLAYGALASFLGYQEVAYLCFIIFGAELAFLYFNIYPARMEMSDVGTLPLGMLIVLVAALIHEEVSLLFIGALFIIEILSSVSQQWSVKLRGKRIFLVAPIHHHFEKLGWPETKVTTRFWLFTVVTSLIGIAIAFF